MCSNTALRSILFIGIGALVYNVNGYGHNKDFIPNTWINDGIYKNGKIDYNRLRELCSWGEDLDQGCTEDKSSIISCKNWGVPDPEFKVTNCGEGRECGKCVEGWDYLLTCHCRDATKPPTFPNNGKISWSGTIKLEEKVVPVHGEIQISKDGKYLLKPMEYSWWSSFHSEDTKSVLIIIPNEDGTFTEYRGDGKGNCKHTTSQTDNRKSLWAHMAEGKAQRENYELVEKTADGKTQKWKHKWDASEGCAMGCSSDSLTSEMTVRKIDGQGNVALPVKFYSNYYVDEWGDFYTNLNFKFEVDSSFTISDYCTN